MLSLWNSSWTQLEQGPGITADLQGGLEPRGTSLTGDSSVPADDPTPDEAAAGGDPGGSAPGPGAPGQSGRWVQDRLPGLQEDSQNSTSGL